jgi:hypothetical protein
VLHAISTYLRRDCVEYDECCGEKRDSRNCALKDREDFIEKVTFEERLKGGRKESG